MQFFPSNLTREESDAMVVRLRALDYGFDVLRADEIVALTALVNSRSRAVMERLGMRRDIAGDVDRPRVAVGHPSRRHVWYRISPPSSRVCFRPAPP